MKNIIKRIIFVIVFLLLINLAYSAPLPPQGLNPYYKELFADWLNETIDTRRSGALREGLNASFYNFNITNNLIVIGNVNISGYLNATNIYMNGQLVQTESPAFKYSNWSLLTDNSTIIRFGNTSWLSNAINNDSIQRQAPAFNLANNATIFMRSADFNIAVNISNYTEYMRYSTFSLSQNITNNTLSKDDNITTSLWNKTGNNIYQRELSGNVGIGTTNPDAKLQVVGNEADSQTNGLVFLNITQATNYPALKIQTIAGGSLGVDTHGIHIINDANGFGLRVDDSTGDTTPFVIDSSGNIGIGNTNPTEKLVVAGNINATGDINLVGASSTLRIGTTGGTGKGFELLAGNTDDNRILAYDRTNAAYIGMNFDAGNYTFKIAADPKVFISNTGNVGIGTTGPNQKLTVSGSLNVIGQDTYSQTSWGNDFVFDMTGTTRTIGFGDATGHKLQFTTRTGSTNYPRVTIQDDGNVGIGTTNPTTLLELQNVNPVIEFEDTDDVQRWQLQGYNTFRIYDVTDDRNSLVIDGSGNVGIGTTTPTRKLHVIGSANVSGDISYGTLTANSPQTFLQKEKGILVPTQFCTMTTSGNILDFSFDDNGQIVKNGLNTTDCMNKEILTSEISTFDNKTNQTTTTFTYEKVFTNKIKNIIETKK